MEATNKIYNQQKAVQTLSTMRPVQWMPLACSTPYSSFCMSLGLRNWSTIACSVIVSAVLYADIGRGYAECINECSMCHHVSPMWPILWMPLVCSTPYSSLCLSLGLRNCSTPLHALLLVSAVLHADGGDQAMLDAAEGIDTLLLLSWLRTEGHHLCLESCVLFFT